MRADFSMLVHNPSAAGEARLLRRVLAARCGDAAPVSMSDPNSLPLVGGLIRRRVRAARNFRRSDHVPFWDRGIPAIQITDTANISHPLPSSVRLMLIPTDAETPYVLKEVGVGSFPTTYAVDLSWEDPNTVWRLKVEDTLGDASTASIQSWSLTL